MELLHFHYANGRIIDIVVRVSVRAILDQPKTIFLDLEMDELEITRVLPLLSTPHARSRNCRPTTSFTQLQWRDKDQTGPRIFKYMVVS